MITVRKIIDTINSTLKQKISDFCSDFDFTRLTPELAAKFLQGLQTAISAAGVAAYGSYISAFDSDSDMIRHEGQLLRKKGGKVGKTYLTSFGEMTIERSLYQADRGGKCVIPLEVLWGMQGQYATEEVREAVVFTTAHCTPQETERILNKCAPFKPSATAIKHIIDGVGRVFVEHKDEVQEHILSKEQIPSETKVIVKSIDGVNVLMREKGKRNRRPAERPGKTVRDEEAESSYKNAMVGSISFYSGKRDADGSPVRLCSRYVSAMPEHRATDFKHTFEREVEHLLADPLAQEAEKVLLMDGSRSLWKYTQANRLYDGFIPVIDFYHTTEHLSRAAEALFGKQNAEADSWYAKLKHKLLHEQDGAAAVLRSIDYFGSTQRLSSTRRKALKAERQFFNRNRSRMNFASLRKKGIPISSGPVEAACKSIVKCRMGRSGMRWSRNGGQHILNFRTLIKSDRWNQAWECYQSYARAA